MANTYIDPNKIPRTKVSGAGEFAEILNNQLCGAKNVVGRLRWAAMSIWMRGPTKRPTSSFT